MLEQTRKRKNHTINLTVIPNKFISRPKTKDENSKRIKDSLHSQESNCQKADDSLLMDGNSPLKVTNDKNQVFSVKAYVKSRRVKEQHSLPATSQGSRTVRQQFNTINYPGV